MPSWDGAKLVYSRESSLSELTSSLHSSSLASLVPTEASSEGWGREREEGGREGVEGGLGGGEDQAVRIG